MIPKQGTYAVSSGDLVKIGTSTDIPKRIRAIQHQSPSPIRLIGTSPLNIEAELQRELRHCHAHGEWFYLVGAADVIRRRLDPRDVEVMETLARDGHLVGGAAGNRMKTHCKRGHELTQDNCMAYALKRGFRICKTCARQKGREYKDRNRERVRADSLAWYHANRDRANARSREWYAANIERERERGRSRMRSPRMKEHSRNYYQAHRDRIRERKKAQRALMTEEQRERERARARRNYAARRDQIIARRKAKRAA